MSWQKRTILVALTLIIVLPAAVIGGGWLWLRSGLPKLDGAVTLPGGDEGHGDVGAQYRLPAPGGRGGLGNDAIRAQAIALYDRFTHEGMDRRVFMGRMVALAGSLAAAEALIGAISASPSGPGRGGTSMPPVAPTSSGP